MKMLLQRRKKGYRERHKDQIAENKKKYDLEHIYQAVDFLCTV